MRITTPGTVIDAKLITGDLTVAANNVKITRSKFVNGSVGSDGDYSNGQMVVTISDSEIAVGNREAKAVTGSFVTVLRSELTGGISGGVCSDCTIQDSYIHGQYQTQGEGWHQSGFRMDQRTRIIHNALTCDVKSDNNGSGCSAALTGYGDWATVQDNLIQNNLFLPSPFASYCAYGGSSTGKPYSSGAHNIVFRDNVFSRGPTGKCAYYAPLGDYNANAPGNQWINNKWDDGSLLTP